MTDLNLYNLFNPSRILLVGASDRVLFSAGIARYLLEHGFADRLTMVNPSGRAVFGRATHTGIAAAAGDGPFDLAIIAIPAPAVPDAIDELAEIGCPFVILESAGFAETGPDGAALQREVVDRARRCGVRVLGPNCVGVVDTTTRFASTEVLEESLRPGGVALIAQSGVFGSILLDWAPSHGLRMSKAITLGNRCDLDEADFLNFLADDPATRVVAMYLEGVADGRRFLDAVAACRRHGKPVVVLKGGRTGPGAHAASLAGSDAVFEGALRQAGGIRARSLEHLTDLARAFDACPAPRGPRVAMITTSGSQGILATDAITEHGLELARFAPETIARVRAIAPSWMTIGNPLDLGPSGIYRDAIAAVLDDPQVDALLLHIAIPWGSVRELFTGPDAIEGLLGDPAVLRAAAGRMPILLSHVGYPRFVEFVTEAYGSFLPIYPTAERAAQTLASMWQGPEAASEK